MKGTVDLAFADVVKVMRQQRRITKADLARRCGLAQSYLSRLESGAYKSPTVDTLVAIAKGLEMDPRDLLVLGGYVPEEFGRTSRALAEDQIARVTQDAIRRISQLAQDAISGSREGQQTVDRGAFDPPSLAASLLERRELVGLSVNQVARRSRVPLQLIENLETAEEKSEPRELQRVLRDGYGLSESEAQLLRVEMSLHSVLRRQPNLSDPQRLMIVDVAVAAIRRESVG